ncbi:MAG: diguanylate phosphodiesterase [Gallionellales bacterium RBG_16_56_9]|nr:MAG: diguanylate phosphodiesterase [Gallionellales bacterium RBG_16_56_9]
MQKIFLARQPIVDRRENLLAFELLFRSANSEAAEVVDGTHATAQVMVNAFEEMGIADVLGAHKGFVNLDADLLHSDLIELLPRKQVVIELLETITIDAAIITRCHELKAKGFSLALDDVVGLSDEIKPLLSVVEVVKLDLMQIDSAQLPGLVRELKQYPVKLLAEKVEDREQARRCLEMGFDMFQGYYFARPEILSGKRTNPSQMVLLRILALMLSDADNSEIEEAFKEHAELAYNLMRMVNSVGTGLGTKISSVKHGLVVMGRQPLQRWVQLLLYASNKVQGKVSPLMQLAATRGKFMELVAQQERPHDSDYADRAFMVGMMSLLDTLIGESLAEIMSRISLHEEVENALLKRSGDMGELLTLCESLETDDMVGLQEKLSTHSKLGVNELNNAQLKALSWANEITNW